MGIDPSNVNNLPKMPKNVAPKNPNEPQNMPQPEGSIMKNLPKTEGQTGFEAVIQPKGEVTVEDKKSQQAHANANKANVDAVAMMKAAAQGGAAGIAEYTGKTADGIEYSGAVDYSGTPNVTGQVNIEHTHANYSNGQMVGPQSWTQDVPLNVPEYSGTVGYGELVGYHGTVGFVLDTSNESWKGDVGTVEYLPSRDGTVGYTPMKTSEKPEVPYNYEYAGSKEVRLEESEMQKILYDTQRVNAKTVEHFDDLNKELLDQ